MIVIRDFECYHCAHIQEIVTDHNREYILCPKCQGTAHKIISLGKINCSNEDAEWLRSVTEVVDKEGGPASREFVKNPTRTNYKKWMKSEGIRPFEPGERPPKPEVNERAIREEVMKRYRVRNRLEVG